jgi:HTH-type transcriptional regulator, competence development regulator
MIHIMKSALGDYLRCARTEKQRREGNAFSLRQLAGRIGVEPSYLSKIERGLEPRPSEETTRALAAELGEDSDVLLAMAGKVSGDLQEIIRKRPQLFAQLIREMKNMPDRAVLRLVREVRDGNW